jgi:molybdenum cofactor biosynthesis protein MoaC
MRDVSTKPNTLRIAKASSSLRCLPSTIQAIKSGTLPKADPIGVAKVAAIQTAKNTSLLIPYCHQVPLDFVGCNVEVKEDSVQIFTEVKAVWKTGVEMEALVAASTAALTLYDMLKMIDDTLELGPVYLEGKSGGKADSPVLSESAIRSGVLVLSDAVSGGRRQDLSGAIIRERLQEAGIPVTEYEMSSDDGGVIEKALLRMCDEKGLDLVLTTGGTGLGPRDVTPEATRKILHRELPGISEFLRAHGQERSRFAMLGRGVAGVRGKTVIVNLPGSPSGVSESLDVLLPWVLHSLEILKGAGH